MDVLEIKALPRTADGVFDLSQVNDNFYRAAEAVYPVYTKYETEENKKAGYPDIMEQMRAVAKRAEQEFTPENAADYLNMLIETIAVISPEIYENYRELVDIFRSKVKEMLADFCLDEEKAHAGLENAQAAQKLSKVLAKAFDMDVLLKEKYEKLAAALAN